MNLAISNWKKVLEETERYLWGKFLMVNFWFLEGSHKLVKCQALKIIGESFQRWKSDLNKNYIQKGLTPFNEFSHITPSQ